MAVFHQIKLTAHNGFDARFMAFSHKFKDTEHIAVVSNGNGGHLVGFCFFKQLFNISRAVEQGVLGMTVEVGELHVGVSVNVFLIKKSPQTIGCAAEQRVLGSDRRFGDSGGGRIACWGISQCFFNQIKILKLSAAPSSNEYWVRTDVSVTMEVGELHVGVLYFQVLYHMSSRQDCMTFNT